MRIKFSFQRKGKYFKCSFLVISKSVNTIETLANPFSLNLLKKNSKNIIIISEKKNNLLFNISRNLNLFHIDHKDYVGGRYSVLSEVGIIPSYLMGVNIINLRKKIRECFSKRNKAFLKDNSIKNG